MSRISTTITLTDSDDDDSDLEVDVIYWFTPGYPATRVDPAAPDDVEIISAKVNGEDAPQWVYDWLEGDYGYATLCADAQGQTEQAACDAASARRTDDA